MAKLRFTISVSVDGFVAGPEQSVKDPLGIGGEQLHEWVVKLEAFDRMHGRAGTGSVADASTPVIEGMFENVGAHVMGRNMFGGGPGDWGDQGWEGWWGDNPPFHNPVFVLTHYRHRPLVMRGGTTFHFVTDGVESALDQAKAAAAGKDVLLGGGADVAGQYLAAGLLDELQLSVVPVMLGDGARLFGSQTGKLPELEQIDVVTAPDVTHLKYRVHRVLN